VIARIYDQRGERGLEEGKEGECMGSNDECAIEGGPKKSNKTVALVHRLHFVHRDLPTCLDLGTSRGFFYTI